MPRWLLKPAGWWVPALRENHEMMYQLDRDYRFCSEKIEKALSLSVTPYPDGVATTWASSN